MRRNTFTFSFHTVFKKCPPPLTHIARHSKNATQKKTFRINGKSVKNIIIETMGFYTVHLYKKVLNKQ